MKLRLPGFSIPATGLTALVVCLMSHSAIAQEEPVTTPAKVISSPEFVLPAAAKAAAIDGQLIVEVSIDKTGNVTRAKAVYGPSYPCNRPYPRKEIEEVRAQVEDIFKKSKFKPALKNSEPQESQVYLRYLTGTALVNFRSRRDAEEAIRRGEARPASVYEGVVNGRALSLPKPDYPAAARMFKATGSVSVSVLIDESGNVIRAEPTDGHFTFFDVAREAACKAKFSSTLLD